MKTVLLGLWLLAIGGCSNEESSSEHLKLFEFDCGRLNYDSMELLGFSDEETDVRTLITPCYVIEHHSGRLLWEGGFQSDLAEVDGWQEMEGGWRIRLDERLSDQLARVNLTLRDFDFVAFSHFHFDHTGVANEVEGATLIIQRSEHETAFADSVSVPGFDPSLYSQFSAANTMVIDGDYDVFGDGSVQLISTPGHTAGHQSLLLQLPSRGAILLSGDLHILREGYKVGWVPFFNADSTQTRRSMRKVQDILELYGADLWIGHDLERFDSLQARSDHLE